MSYNIGQIRSNQIETFSSPVPHSTKRVRTEDEIITFHDFAIEVTGSGFEREKSYYLKVEVTEIASSMQEFTIKLKRDGATVDSEMHIRRISVNRGTGKSIIELVFSPNAPYNQVVFEMHRLALDFTQQNSDGTNGRIASIVVKELVVLNNIVDVLKTKVAGLTHLKKIGLQAVSGQIFVIDGEEIRVGRTGIYELYHDIPISSLGFVIKNPATDFIILDYKY